MSVLDDIKAKVDANGDGKLSLDDLNELKDKLPTDKFDELKNMADQNDDGKVNFDDVKNLDFGDLINDAKSAFGDVFGGDKK